MQRAPQDERNGDGARVHHQDMLETEAQEARQLLHVVDGIATDKFNLRGVAFVTVRSQKVNGVQ
jgi:hypothetical protein